MKAIYVQQGAALDYTAAEDVKNGAVVSLGTRIGIAAGDIPAGPSMWRGSTGWQRPPARP